MPCRENEQVIVFELVDVDICDGSGDAKYPLEPRKVQLLRSGVMVAQRATFRSSKREVFGDGLGSPNQS